MENLNAYLNSLGCFLLAAELKEVWNICQPEYSKTGNECKGCFGPCGLCVKKETGEPEITCNACGLISFPDLRFSVTYKNPEK